MARIDRDSPDAGHLPSAVRRLPSQAFTLVELLVVLGLFALLMSITVVGILRTPRTNALVAAQQVVGDLVRQARHTARSSGGPVVLKLSKDKSQITGAIRTALWEYSEGWAQFPAPEPPIAGRTGLGLRPAAIYDVTAPGFTYNDAQALDRRQRLDTGRRGMGFALTVSVRMDQIQDPDAAFPVEPLVLLTSDPTGKETEAVAGLLLCRDYDPAAHDPANWSLVGWVRDGTTTEDINTVDDVLAELVDKAGRPAAATQDPLVPITGGVWEEFTLVSDGRSLSLLRDGRLVARRDGLTLDDLAPATHVVIGYQEGHLIGHSTNDNARRATRGVIDDVRLERIGSGLSANLPGDMQPSADATITCFPDGRVRVNGADAGDITVWSRNDTTLKAIVSIAAGGAVTVKKIEP